MKTLSGRVLAPGLAAGKAFIYHDILQRSHERYDIESHEVEEELARIERALAVVAADLAEAAASVEGELDKEHASIFLAQKTLLEDSVLLRELRQGLQDDLVNAEHVVKQVFRRWERRFREKQDEVFSARGDDVADLSRRLLRALIGIHVHALEGIPRGSIVVARRLLPSDTAVLSRKSAAGVALEFGGPASHAAILTREIGIPAVSGIGNVTAEIGVGDPVIVDGLSGTVTVDPSGEAFADFEKRAETRAVSDRELEERAHEKARTSGGILVEVAANMGCREDAVAAAQKGADAIGLYRIEHLYLTHKSLPLEKELVDRLREAIEPMKGKGVTIRLLDVGGDKELQFVQLPEEENPFLGQRGVRLLLQHTDLLKSQLRALARLRPEHDVRILVPMVTVAEDVVRVREILRTCVDEVHAGDVPPLGAMIETPAAALCASEIAKVADFMSVGTNDLTQYTMAAGRENPLVSNYFADDHPAVLKLLELTVRNAGDTPVSICGELAGHVDAVEALVGMGYRHLSMAPGAVPAVKAKVRSLA